MAWNAAEDICFVRRHGRFEIMARDVSIIVVEVLQI